MQKCLKGILSISMFVMLARSEVDIQSVDI